MAASGAGGHPAKAVWSSKELSSIMAAYEAGEYPARVGWDSEELSSIMSGLLKTWLL